MDEDYSRKTDRRRLLAVLGTGATGFLAGCSGGDSGSQPSDDDNTTSNPEPGDSTDNGNESSSSGNGAENTTEPENDNGTDDGGTGEPENLLQAANILDGDRQVLSSLTLGDGENATTNAEIYLGIEGDGEAQYTVQTNTDLEQLAQALNQEGTVTPENPVQLAELNWENLNDIEEQVNTQLQATAQNQGGQVNASLPITVQEDSLNLQEMHEDNLAKRERAIQNTEKSKGNYSHSFTDLENLRKIADFYGVDLEIAREDELINFLNTAHESTDNLKPKDLSSKYISTEPYDNGTAVTREFNQSLDPFEIIYKDNTFVGFEDGRIVNFTIGEQFPQAFEEFLAGDAPSIADETEGDEYTDWGFHETDVWEDNIVLFYGENLGIPGGREYEKFPIWSFNTIMMDPETGELRETFFNSQKNGEDEIVWEADPVHDYRNLKPERLGGYQFSY